MAPSAFGKKKKKNTITNTNRGFPELRAQSEEKQKQVERTARTRRRSSGEGGGWIIDSGSSKESPQPPLPRNPSVPTPKHEGVDHDDIAGRGGLSLNPHHPLYLLAQLDAAHHQPDHYLFFFGRLDSPPAHQTHVRSKPSLISPAAKGTTMHPPRQSGAAAASSRLGTRRGRVRGEIVKVEGGHIVRSMGRKDRHSKVCTAKGPRDRRVRLSATTAIQFYDVQDRLGYDRPSKAVDWLIKEAKPAIDELAQLPSWIPTATAVTSPAAAAITTATAQQETMIDFCQAAALDHGEGNALRNLLRQHRRMDEIDRRNNGPAASSSLLPSSLDSDTVADTIQSVPMGVPSDQSAATSSSMQFHGYPPDLILRTSSQSQDLCLSLQSFQQQPLLMLPHHSQTNDHSRNQQADFTGAPHHRNQLVLDGSSSSSSAASMWLSDHQRVLQWNSSGGDAGISIASGSGGFMFGSLAVAPMPTHFGQQGQFLQQRGPLQSSNMASVRACIDPTTAITTDDDDHHQATLGVGPMGSYPGYSDILAPTRGQGEEMHEGILDRPSSASSDSHSRH